MFGLRCVHIFQAPSTARRAKHTLCAEISMPPLHPLQRALNKRTRSTLTALIDTFLATTPDSKSGFYETIETILYDPGAIPWPEWHQLSLLLTALGTTVGTAGITMTFATRPFAAHSPGERQFLLRRCAASRVELQRKAFLQLQKLVLDVSVAVNPSAADAPPANGHAKTDAKPLLSSEGTMRETSPPVSRGWFWSRGRRR